MYSRTLSFQYHIFTVQCIFNGIQLNNDRLLQSSIGYIQLLSSVKPNHDHVTGKTDFN